MLTKLTRPIVGDRLDPSLIDKQYETLLRSALKHPDEDVRTASMYLLDLLMNTDQKRVERIITSTLKEQAPLGLRTLEQFLTHSAFNTNDVIVASEKKLHSLPQKPTIQKEPPRPFAPGPSPQSDMPEGASSAAEVLVVIHGTWASGEDWWRWGSEFTTYLDGLTKAVYKKADAFSWSGNNSDAAREEAATSLVKWVRDHPAQNLVIVAHSHGGNVAMLAARKGLKIDRLILLGTPIRTEYTPDLREGIKLLYNVYSIGDRVQTIGAKPQTRGDGRTVADSSEAVNFRVRDSSGSDPGHADLHSAAIWTANRLDRLVK